MSIRQSYRVAQLRLPCSKFSMHLKIVSDIPHKTRCESYIAWPLWPTQSLIHRQESGPALRNIHVSIYTPHNSSKVFHAWLLLWWKFCFLLWETIHLPIQSRLAQEQAYKYSDQVKSYYPIQQLQPFSQLAGATIRGLSIMIDTI